MNNIKKDPAPKVWQKLMLTYWLATWTKHGSGISSNLFAMPVKPKGHIVFALSFCMGVCLSVVRSVDLMGWEQRSSTQGRDLKHYVDLHYVDLQVHRTKSTECMQHRAECLIWYSILIKKCNVSHSRIVVNYTSHPDVTWTYVYFTGT